MKFKKELILAVILFFGLFLRVYALGSESIWQDEGFSVSVAHMNLSELIATTAADVHPPLYYLLLHYWISIFGDSEFSCRFLSALFGYVNKPTAWVSLDWPVGKLALQLDVVGAIHISLWSSIFTLMFIDLFDSLGTLIACCEKAGMRDKRGQIRGLDRLLGIDAVATMVGALLGTSTTTAYVESAAGIEQGGRTGLTSVVTGLLFLLALFFVPVIAVVPGYATAPALIVVGYFMMKEARKINLRKPDELIPSLIIVVMIAVSYQISMGLALGFVSFVIVKVLFRRWKDVHPAMWLIAGLSLIFLAIRWWPGE